MRGIDGESGRGGDRARDRTIAGLFTVFRHLLTRLLRLSTLGNSAIAILRKVSFESSFLPLAPSPTRPLSPSLFHPQSSCKPDFG